MATQPSECGNHDCDVLTSGRCVEGENPDQCPYRQGRRIIVESEEPDLTNGNEEERERTPELRSVRQGTRLNQAECGPLLASSPGRVVALVAPREAGKTSLIAGTYELFLEGRASRYLYRDSTTLMDFERISHLSRAMSGLTKADMARTKHAEGLGYYHLELQRAGERFTVLLGDRPGETFLTAAASLDQARQLRELESCSAVVFLVDGAMLASPAAKNKPKAHAETILSALAESGLLKENPALALVLTKADIVDRDKSGAASGRFDKIVQEVDRRYASYFSQVVSFRTAANPGPDGSHMRGEGMELLVNFLLEDHRPGYCLAATSSPSRAFGRFGRQLGAAE